MLHFNTPQQLEAFRDRVTGSRRNYVTPTLAFAHTAIWIAPVTRPGGTVGSSIRTQRSSSSLSTRAGPAAQPVPRATSGALAAQQHAQTYTTHPLGFYEGVASLLGMMSEEEGSALLRAVHRARE